MRAPRRPLGLGHELLPLTADVRPHGGEARQVDIDGPLADDVAPGRGAGRLAEAGQQRAHDHEAGPQADHQLAWRGEVEVTRPAFRRRDEGDGRSTSTPRLSSTRAMKATSPMSGMFSR